MERGMEQTLTYGLAELLKLGAVVTVLVLAIVILLWFIRELLRDAKQERQLNRDALVNNTAVLSELKELIRHVAQK
jgi:hypothetical protein